MRIQFSPLGLYPQPNDWTCGLFALKHALVTLGRSADEESIGEVARPHWWSGTDEIRLARAARAFDCDLDLVRTCDPARAKRDLVATLRKRIPVVLCVDQWEHWITAVRYESSRFVIIDSNLDPVLDSVTWNQMRRRWRYLDYEYDDDEPPEVYDYYAIKPRGRSKVQASFSLARVRALRRQENRRLAEHWNEYLEDLLEICRPRSTRHSAPLSMGEFLRRNQELIVSRVLYWHGEISRTLLNRLLRDLRFVAETYGLVIPASAQRQAVADVAVLTALAAASIGGMGAIYGMGGER